MKQEIGVCIFVVIFVVWMASLVWIYWWHRAKQRRDYEKMAKEERCEPNATTCIAVVISKNCEIVYTNSSPKYPQHKLAYTVTFSVDGKAVTYEVNEQVFERVDKGQSGLLITVNGTFHDFDA